MALIFTLGGLLAGIALWCGWRVASHRAMLPCPSELRWLVELENPIARATRSRSIVAHLGVTRGEKIIDVGCGPGRVTLPLAEAVGPHGQIIALDVQDEMLAAVRTKAAARKLENITFVQSDGATFQITADDADAAVLVMMLGEATEPLELLRSVFRALKADGRLLVSESVFDPHYVRRGTLRRLAEAAGFVGASERGNCVGYSVLFTKASEPTARTQSRA